MTGARLALALLTMSLAGCGGHDDEPAADVTATHAGTVMNSAPYDAPAVSRAAAHRRERRRAARRRELTRSVAKSQVDLLGVDNPAIATKAEARSVTITLTSAAACAAPKGFAHALSRALQDALSFVDVVKVRVYRYRGSLAAYRRQRCHESTGVAGRPLFETAGIGSRSVGTLTIASRRWTLDYEATAPFTLRLLRAGTLVRQIGPPRGGAGSRTIVGAGVYTIEVEAENRWSLTARAPR